MKVGFTSPRGGMTPQQGVSLRRFLEAVIRMSASTKPEFHHGDCVGGDEEAHGIARELGFWIVGHPPDNPTMRAWCDCDELRPEKPYLDRNKDVVDETDVLASTPSGVVEELRSGTWSTIRYARKRQKPRIMIWPDGSASREVA